MSKHPVLALLIACLSLPLLSSQSQGQAAPDDPATLPGLPPAKDGDLLCRCISTFLPGKNEIFYFKMDNTYHKVALTGEGISLPFPVRGTSTFTLYTKTVSEEDKVVYTPVVEQALKGSGGKYIVIISRPKDKTTLKAKTFNINTANYPANHVYLFNESPVSLGLQVNDTKAVVKPFETYKYSYQNAGRDTYTSAKIVMGYKGESKVMASKRLRLVPGRRMILVCFPSKTRTQMGATPLGMVLYQDKP
ncbi:MAG: hypothetical protein H7A51_12640 [Akkermansiaceae bacterium]|nr:hypothetical protein [Akkermansiaceae bacterium]